MHYVRHTLCHCYLLLSRLSAELCVEKSDFLVVHWTYRQCYTHTKSYKNLRGSSPDRYARGSANRLNAVIASTTQMGSPRNHTPALDSGLPVYARQYNDAIMQTPLHGLSACLPIHDMTTEMF